jgi:nucleotide-binding universal stress UspA family protein
MIRNVLIGLDGSVYSDSAVELGLRWGKRTGALLAGLAVVDEPTIRSREIRGTSPGQVLRGESRLKEAEARVDHLLERFAERCAGAGAAGQTLRKVGLPWEEILWEAEDYDLTVMGKQTYFQLETQEYPDPTFDLVLRNSRRPVVAVPLKLPTSAAVVVAYNAAPAAVRALEALQRCELLVDQSIHVVSVARREAEAARHAEEAATFLRFYGLHAQPRPLATTRAVAEVLLEQVRELDAGLVVLGAYGSSSFQEAFRGSKTQAVLEQAEVVLFLHR